MSDWVLVPALVELRSEFNTLAPKRDKGADGSISDSNHTSASDHTPDEDSSILRDHDADNKNEVHALDIDSSGPWPGVGTQKQRFHKLVMRVIEGEKAKWRDANDMCRLNYVIWDDKIYDKDNDFEPRAYQPTNSSRDPHTNHAHFSNRYETKAENDTRPFGVGGEEDMPITPAEMESMAQSVASKLYADLKNTKSGLYTALAERSAAGTTTALKALGLDKLPEAVAVAVLKAVGDSSKSPEEVAAVLKPVLGTNAAAVGRALQS